MKQILTLVHEIENVIFFLWANIPWTWDLKKIYLYPASYFFLRNTKKASDMTWQPPLEHFPPSWCVISKKNVLQLLFYWQVKALGWIVVYNNKKWPNNWMKRPKLPKILKVESIWNYTISYQSASMNRWRHWRTRDLGVWH